MTIDDGPMFIHYDQEPIYGEYNYQLFDYIKNNFQSPFVLVTTEKNSKSLNEVHDRYKWPMVYYFFHAFAAADWFRGYRYHCELTLPNKRILKKKYITFNRITGNARVYRSFLIAELTHCDILDYGHVSYSDTCPEHGHYEPNLLLSIERYNVPAQYATQAKTLLDTVKFPLRIDHKNKQFIQNGSQTLNAIPEMMESFLHVVTETCFWDEKDHLTEKIFKPIVARMPFVLVGCTNNLAYLRSYGFKTFDQWWDESYDSIADPIQRLQAVVKIIEDICNKSNTELESILVEMQPILDHNHNLFYSHGFLDICWDELTTNLESAIAQLLAPTS